ncbi:50S ribosomal protein L25/general stress protein Ctc [Rhodococcus sp. X156]|uniref:50S ribosomal protein L25/general stress protein Ctc n=1 Tax=Rhodococcus sp. X156 TaxID=2499145 RepID=UPI000FD93A5B|nr:50S ribosomal protein L25/general stress protein Ctc [Rhodococcus sp. X156]
MAENITLNAEKRTEFGKGAARRTRNAGKVPAVVYGHGTDPVHLALPALEFARVLRAHGTNAVITVTADGEEHLALVKTVVVHPLRNYIEHADLLVIRRGEKVNVEIPVTIVGDPAPGALVTQDASTVEVEADVMTIPEQIEVSIDGRPVGTQIVASDLALPEGATLVSDPEMLVVNIVEAPSEAALEAELDTEGAGVVEDAPDEGTVADEAPAADNASEADQS